MLVGDYMNVTETTLIPAATKWMCSAQCPCRGADKAPWIDLQDAGLLPWGRTSNVQGTTGKNNIFFPGDPVSLATDFYEAITFFDCYYDWERDWKMANKTNGVSGKTPSGW